MSKGAISSSISHAAGGFSPTDITGCELWLDATDVWSGTEPSNNDNIGAAGEEWQDLSGNGYHVSQSTGTKQPTYKTGILNGLPGIYFDGGDNLKTSSAQTIAQGLTVFTVTQLTATTSGQTFYDSYDTSNRCVFYIDAGNFTMFAGSNDRSYAANTNANYHRLIWNGTSSNLYENGTLKKNTSPGTNSLSLITLGSFNNSTNYLTGYIFEVIVYSSVLSAGDITSVEDYLSTKWGL